MSKVIRTNSIKRKNKEFKPTTLTISIEVKIDKEADLANIKDLVSDKDWGAGTIVDDIFNEVVNQLEDQLE